MSVHKVSIAWQRSAHTDRPDTYAREHIADYGSGLTLPVTAGAAYLGDPSKADPEQLLVNAVASCHMLFFLALAEGSGYVVESYADDATGTVAKSDSGGFWVSRIELRPEARFSGAKLPDAKAIERLHDRAHKGCFVGNSLKSEIIVSPVI
ncbi:MAG: OsmC family protein [Rhizobiaceae bacterium]|nr:OsmC family protein [Rhizobiaceae bacterium]